MTRGARLYERRLLCHLLELRCLSGTTIWHSRISRSRKCAPPAIRKSRFSFSSVRTTSGKARPLDRSQDGVSGEPATVRRGNEGGRGTARAAHPADAPSVRGRHPQERPPAVGASRPADRRRDRRPARRPQRPQRGGSAGTWTGAVRASRAGSTVAGSRCCSADGDHHPRLDRSGRRAGRGHGPRGAGQCGGRAAWRSTHCLRLHPSRPRGRGSFCRDGRTGTGKECPRHARCWCLRSLASTAAASSSAPVFRCRATLLGWTHRATTSPATLD